MRSINIFCFHKALLVLLSLVLLIPNISLSAEYNKSNIQHSNGNTKRPSPEMHAAERASLKSIHNKSKRKAADSKVIGNQKRGKSSLDKKLKESNGRHTYKVKAGDVFGKVAQKYQPPGVSLKNVMSAFYKINKDAFVGKNQRYLIVGYTLLVPTPEELGVKSDIKLDVSLSKTPVKAEPKPKPFVDVAHMTEDDPLNPKYQIKPPVSEGVRDDQNFDFNSPSKDLEIGFFSGFMIWLALGLLVILVVVLLGFRERHVQEKQRKKMEAIFDL
jgi:LysM repeat protein